MLKKKHLENVLKFIFKLFLTLAILWLLFINVNLGKIYESYQKVQVFDLITSMILIVSGSLLIPAIVSKRSLKAGALALSLWDLIRVNFAVRFYSLILPRGMVTGIRWLQYRNKGKGSEAAVLIIFEKLVQIIIMMAFAVVFLLIDRDVLGPEGQFCFWVALGLFILIILAFIPFCIPKSSVFLENYLRKLPTRLPSWVSRKSQNLLTAFGGFRFLSWDDVLVILAWSFLGHVLCILGGYVLVGATCCQVDLFAFAWIRSIILFLSLMPLTIGNLGVREAGYVYFMGLYTVPPESALAFSFSLFTVQILSGLLGGVSELFRIFNIRSLLLRSPK